jgi:hypothetical protein
MPQGQNKKYNKEKKSPHKKRGAKNLNVFEGKFVK